MTPRGENKLHLAWASALTLATACAFYVPALRATHGDWPAPLDDVFIHFDFARSWATGHPFEWIAGQGYSSGETSPLYAVVLALGYAIGFHGASLGIWAAAIAVASIVSLLRSVRTIVLRSGGGRTIAWMTAPMFLAIGVLDWTWFSGMEVALFGAVVGRTLVAAACACEAPPDVRVRAQWTCAWWCALLVMTRPESIVIAFVLAVAIARRASSQSGWAAAARVIAPSIFATLTVAALNFAFTGEAASAGARLKLLSANPFASDVGRAREFVQNLAFVRWKIFGTQLTSFPRAWPLVPLLALTSLTSRRTRAMGAACLASALAFALLVSWNGAARFQNYRYYMPALALLLVAASLGVVAIAARRISSAFALVPPLAAIALAAPRIGAQIDFFRDASSNIHDQQVEVGRRLARAMPASASVLVGDAGAIPYFAERHAIDALGLGGFRGVPFVRGAPIGEAATLELLERLAPDDRPAYLALYPNWFGAITSRFGHEIDRVTIDHNVICGGVTKGIYAADWSALDAADARASERYFDSVDVADVTSEAEHAYESPAPEGGWPVLDVRATKDRARLFDGGRIVPEGKSERFVIARGASSRASIDLRTDESPADIDLDVARKDGSHERISAARSPGESGAWSEAHALVQGGVAKGDVITITARRGAFHDYHVWIRAL